MEFENANLKDVKKMKEKLTIDLANEKERYHTEKQKKQELEAKVKELEIKCTDLKNISDENAKRYKE